jgi:multiple sugar transport system permease protein
MHVKDRTFVLLLLAPAGIFMLLFVLYPLALLIIKSFTDATLVSQANAQFVGLANYATALGNPLFQGAALRTALYTLIVVPSELLLGLGAALLFNAFGKASTLPRAIFAFPLMISPIVAGLLWRFLLSDNFGVVNWILYWTHILHDPTQISWLSNPHIVLLSVAVPDIWLTTSFVALVLYAGLQGVPPELLEAARIDGASAVQAFLHIVLPLLRPLIAIVLIVRGVDAAKTFDVIWLQTQGGPNFASEVLSLQIYRSTIRFGNLGIGAAEATMFVGVMLIVSIVATQTMWRTPPGARRG